MGKVYKVAIIGGGASGLFSAEALSSVFGDQIIVLEKLNRVGKKITVTGNGRGNFTNRNLSETNYHSKEGDVEAFVRGSLSKYGNAKLISFLSSIGCCVAEENGRVYPSSFQASSVLDLLRLRLEQNGAEIRTDFEVVNVERGKNFTVTSKDGEKIYAEIVILAVGGKCQKQFGTDGSGYALAKKLGHSITECLPALVQLKTETDDLKTLKGIRQEVLITLCDGNQPKTCEKGDLLFTEFGVSGNAVFGLSGYAVASKQPELIVEFLPEMSEYELLSALNSKVETAPYLTAEDLLTGIINKQVGRVVLKRAGVDLKNKISRDVVKKAVKELKNFKIKVTGTLGFNYAQVTRGGVRLFEVDRYTMQSLKIEGAYLVGELLDVDGDCGGYNLQWAYSSAMTASDDILSKSGLNRAKTR